MQMIDILTMHSMKWLCAHLHQLKDEGYIIDSVVVGYGEVIIVYRAPPVADAVVVRKRV